MYLQIQKINRRETQQKPYLVISTSAFTRLTVSMRSGGPGGGGYWRGLKEF